jgi:hypothetical protein
MYLTELRGLIANTAVADWLVVDGPLFHESTSTKLSNMTGQVVVDRPASRAVLVSNIDVALEWGLPWPHLAPQDAVSDLGFSNVAAWRVSKWSHALCRLVDALEDGEQFDDYFKRVGFVVEG